MNDRTKKFEAAVRSGIVSLDDILVAWDRLEGRCRTCKQPFEGEPTVGQAAAMKIFAETDGP